MKKSKFYLVWGVAAFLVISIIFSFIIPSIVGVGEAREVVDEFYSYAGSDSYDSKISLFHEKFFTVTSREDLLVLLEDVDSTLGVVEDYALINFEKTSSVNQRTAILIYGVTRTKYNSTEKFSLIMDDETESFLIAGYFVESDGFKEEVETQ